MNKVNKKFIPPAVAIIDDSSQSRKIISEILERNNIEVAGVAAGAEDGISLVATTNANIYLIDLFMPLRSGLEISKMISDKSRNVFTIIISSVNTEALVIESIRAGAIGFLPKPINEKSLMKSIQKITQEMNRE